MQVALDLIFPIVVSSLVCEFLEPGIVLHTLTGEKIFFNQKKLIRDYGYFKFNKYGHKPKFEEVRCFRTENNVLYFCHKQKGWLQLSGSNWIVSVNNYDADEIIGTKVNVVYKNELCSLELKNGIFWLNGAIFFSKSFYNGRIFVFNDSVYVYTGYCFSYFDLNHKKFVLRAKPPFNISLIENSIIFNECLYIFGCQDVIIYCFQNDTWIHQIHNKFLQKIIGCLLS